MTPELGAMFAILFVGSLALILVLATRSDAA